MKTASCFFVFLCLIICQTFAQSIGQKPWLEVIESNNSEIFPHELEKLDRLVDKGLYENYWTVDVANLESVIINDELNINIPDRTFNAKFRKSWVGGSGSGQSIWEGKDYPGSGYALIMLDDGLTFGHFRSQGEDYILYNMEESKASVLVKQNKNYFLGDKCGNELLDEEENRGEAIAPIQNESSSSASNRLMAIRNCDVRVLIYFTQEAQDDNPNIVQTGQLGVAQTNMALRNSAVTANDLTIVQASIQKLSPLPIGWTGSSMSTDVALLRVDQRVIDRRDEIGADLVLCLVSFPSNGYFAQGIANDRTLNPALAFGLVSESHAVGNTLIFAHECGHLFGCGHHNENDPFARGHSFIKWFTIYRTIVRGGEGDRIPYYSNPNVTYLGKATGTSTRDNARRLRESGCTVANHRTTNNPSLSASIQGPTNGYPYDYALFQSDVDGGAPGVYSYEWRTSTSGAPNPTGPVLSTSFNFAITLPNTPYSNLYIHLRVTSADGQVRNSVHTIYIEPGLGPFRLASTVDLNNNNITVYPIPVQDKATIIFETNNSGRGQILVHNSFGTIIKQDYFEHESGNVRLKYGLGDLKEGIYVIKVHADNTTWIKKIIVK